MTEDEYMARIWELWPAGLSHSQWVENKPLYGDLAATVEEALRAYPESSWLWCIRGNLSQLQSRPWDSSFDPEGFLESYRKAVALDDLNWYAWECMANLLEVYSEEYAEAERLFSKAISLGAEQWSYHGRARALAQMGRRQVAIEQLTPENCPYADCPEIVEVRKEIDEGEWDSPEPEARGQS